MEWQLINKTLFPFIVIFSLFSCAQENKNQSEKQIEKVSNTELDCIKDHNNPNGSSELSLLMRNMLKHAQSERNRVLINQTPGDYPASFNKIYTAIPTDAETKKLSFNGFADLYLQAINEYHQSKIGNSKKRFTAIVNACLACHSDHCPGPLSAINKLKLD